MKFITIFAVFLLTIPMEVKAGDCASMASKGYCVNSMYRQVMCSSCTAQCDALGGTATCTLPVKSSACSDVATNCASLAYLCNNALYANLLSQRCSSTCNTCGGVVATTTTAAAGVTTTTVAGAATTTTIAATTTTTVAGATTTTATTTTTTVVDTTSI